MQKIIDTLLKKIKSKSQIKHLEDEFILERIRKFLKTNGDIRVKLEKEFKLKQDKITKSKVFKEIVKSIRWEIGVIYGSFLTKDFPKKKKFMESNYKDLLKLHKSTKERIELYEKIYKQIFKWYKPKKIGDLGCGLNPISYEIIERTLKYKPEYFASDLNPEDMKFLNDYFSINKIKGKAKVYNITNLEILKDKDFKECDLIFLFKVLDSLEFIKKNISKKLLDETKSKHIVVSFPMKSLVSKKNFDFSKRNWFKNYINKMNWNYKVFEIENEIFYLIKK